MISDATRRTPASHADSVDRFAEWPAESLAALALDGVFGWSIPPEFGGLGLSSLEMLKGSEEIAACCLTTAFILSQREAAVRRVLVGAPTLRERFLPSAAKGECFLTVGLSQLTTSRQHGGPALRATKTTGGWRLDGEIPWVTGADRADAIVVGATLSDAQQVLFLLPRDRRGATVEEPLPLASLVGSRTSLIRCEGVVLEDGLLLAGPAEHVLGKVGGGGLETSCLAIALARASTEILESEASARPGLKSVADGFADAIDEARRQMHAFASTAATAEQTLSLRVQATKLALRTSQAALTATKGAGFLSPHPAQRLTRQALFFLVWSCPRPVAEGVMEDLAAVGGPQGAC